MEHEVWSSLIHVDGLVAQLVQAKGEQLDLAYCLGLEGHVEVVVPDTRSLFDGVEEVSLSEPTDKAESELERDNLAR